MTSLRLWAVGPFELLLHAEGHLRLDTDFDRRMALISYDNSIEVSISTYLTLPPLIRDGKTYSRDDIDRWVGPPHRPYEIKLDFLDAELRQRSLAWAIDKKDIVYAHYHRNEQYHGGHKGAPERSILDCIRTAALWVYSVLYEDPDVETRLAQTLAGTRPPQRRPAYDRAIDRKHGMIEIGGLAYHASEILFNVDMDAYQTEGERLCHGEADAGDEVSEP